MARLIVWAAGLPIIGDALERVVWYYLIGPGRDRQAAKPARKRGAA